jgi:hypothetical protein
MPGHQPPHQEKETPVEPAVELLKSPLAILRKDPGPEIKGREQQHESGRKIHPHDERD